MPGIMSDSSGPMRRSSTGMAPTSGLLSGFVSKFTLPADNQTPNVGVATPAPAAETAAPKMDGPKRRASTGTAPMPSLLSGLTRSLTLEDPSKNTSPAVTTDSAPAPNVDMSMYEESGPTRLKPAAPSGVAPKEGGKMRRASTGTVPHKPGEGGDGRTRKVSTMRNWFFQNSVPTIAEGPEVGTDISQPGLQSGAAGMGSLGQSVMAAGITSSAPGRRQRVKARDLNAFTPMNW